MTERQTQVGGKKNRKGSEVDFLGDTDIVRYKFNSNVAESEI